MNVTAARRLARNLMQRHGLQIWKLKFINHGAYAGLCTYSAHTISLSVEYVQAYNDTQVTQLVLHEIAHVKRGPNSENGHDEKWLRIARKLGYEGGEFMPEDYPRPEIVWDITCPNTGLIQEVTEQPETEDCKNCNDADCTPIIERRQLVRADYHSIPAPEPVFTTFIRKLKSYISITA